MICPSYNLSCICFVLYIICPVYGLSTYDLSSIWVVLHKICSDMIGPHHVMRIIFPSNDFSYISCHFYMCPTNFLSYIRFFLRIMPNNELGKYLCHNIFLKKHITIFSYYTFFSIILIASVWILFPLYNSFVSSFFIKNFTFLYKFGLNENKNFGWKKIFSILLNLFCTAALSTK